MINRLANPLPVKQAPDARVLKTTTLSVASQPLSTPPFAQEYFEPGVNTKLTRRSKPKTNYTLPSDMPTYPIGFVPTNQTPGANGEEPSIVPVKEAVPADLLQVFARIAAEEKLAEAQPKYGVDMGSRIMHEYSNALKEIKTERKLESMMRDGFTQTEAETAMNAVRAEEAIKAAKEPAKPVPVETAIAEVMGKVFEVPEPVPINERMNIPYTSTAGRSFKTTLKTPSEAEERKLMGRPTKEQVEVRTIEQMMRQEQSQKTQPPITKFFGKK